MAGAQVRRFLILHKELDADDGELTRTQKVRRGFVAERYAPLVKALYDGSNEADISTEVTFEDGRKGVHVGARRRSATCATVPVAAPAWRRRHESAGRQRHCRRRDPARGRERVAGVRRRAAIRDVSFDIRKGEVRAIIGPNGAGKTSMLNVINGFYQPQQGRITFKGETRREMQPHDAARGGHRAHLPERRAVQGHERRSTTSWPAAR